MNLYIRYFDDEVVVKDVEEALQFISTIQGFNITPQFEEDFRSYAGSPMPYPKRYKVRARVYFIVIKTTAATLEEFKANGKAAQAQNMGFPVEGGEPSPVELEAQFTAEAPRAALRPREQHMIRLNDEHPGWYEASIHFKRVIRKPSGKCDYVDTDFVARLKAHSGMDCYNRIIDHLHTRADIDPRSQFPSPKGKNYRFTFLGFKPYAELGV